MKILIIGGGFAGCASAEILSHFPNSNIVLVEKGNELGAGVRTHFYGGHPYTYGPRHFLTENKETFDYLKNLCNFQCNLCIHIFYHILKRRTRQNLICQNYANLVLPYYCVLMLHNHA